MTDQPPNPHLLFCPYLPIKEPVTFADWELGPLQSFENRWADPRFKAHAIAFLHKFVGTDNEPIDNPALLCRQGRQLDGEEPSPKEVRALELALVFALVDRNPRGGPGKLNEGSCMVTTENAALHQWPIDVEHGYFTKITGGIVEVQTFDRCKTDDPKRVLSPPLDLHMPTEASPDPLVLTGVYETVLRSLRSPGKDPPTDHVRVAVDWFAKAWHNTATVECPERLVYLKTAFEALTGTSTNWKSARKLREIFEALPHTTECDSKVLVWSPEEQSVHIRNWVDKCGRSQSILMTDLERWFIEFGKARNTIIHKGQLSQLTYSGPNPAYNGHYFSTAEFILRGVIKVLLSNLGYDNVWRPELLRTIEATLEEQEDY